VKGAAAQQHGQSGPLPGRRVPAPAVRGADDRRPQPKHTVVPPVGGLRDRQVVPGVDARPDSSSSPGLPAVVETMAAARPEPQAIRGPTTAKASLRLVAGFLTAALAPFVVPLPGSPVEHPTQWAVLAWLRRQSDRGARDRRPSLVANPRQTEQVEADASPARPARATVDRIDKVTGRVTGSVDTDGPDGVSYELARQIDRRLGSVTVDRVTGQWAFAPTQPSRLTAALSQEGGVVEFAITASDGRTIDVRAPIDQAEAAVTGTIDVGDALVYGLAAVGDRLYVLNGADGAGRNGAVKIFDTATRMVAGSIEVGRSPFAVAVSGRKLYVGNADDGTVSVVDVASNGVVDVIAVGAHPFGLEVSGDRLYVADHAGTVSVVDLNDNTELTRIRVAGNPFAVAATADRVYVTNYVGGTVAVVDRATSTAVDAVAVGGYPYYAAVAGGRLYVVNAATNALTIVEETVDAVVDFDPATGSVGAVPSGAVPVDFVVRGDRIYVSNVNCGTVTVIDVATSQPVETIGVGINPGLITATADGRTVYVADVMEGTVRVISSVRHMADG
jgi:YVTN family beta-propeller protein